MTDELVGTLDGATSDGKATPALFAVIDAVLMVGKIIDQAIAIFLAFFGRAFHPLQSGDDESGVVVE